MKISIDQTVFKRAAFWSLIFFAAAHAFCFFNLTYASGSVLIDVSRNATAQIERGVYLQPFYWSLRGSLSSPMIVGILCCVYLTTACYLMLSLLRLNTCVSAFALCGLMTLNVTITLRFSGSLTTADASMLALLLGIFAAALTLRLKWGFLPGAVLAAGAMALDTNGFSLFLAPLLLVLIADALNDTAPIWPAAAKAAASCGLGVVLYAAGGLILWRILDLEPMFPTRSFFAAESFLLMPSPLLFYHPVPGFVLYGVLLFLAFFSLLHLLRRLPHVRAVFVFSCSILFPFVLSLLLDQEHIADSPVFAFFPVLLLLLLHNGLSGLSKEHLLRTCAAGVLSVFFLSSVVLSNQLYLKKNIEFQSTLSLMTRVIDRMERTTHYMPGQTPVVFAGTLENSILSAKHKGFAELSRFDPTVTLCSSSEETLWYLWEILGYPVNLLSLYEQEQWSKRPDVAAMPVFPAAGSCQMIDDTLVIKLSDS